MRLLHTADWHLGRLFYGVSLLRDQEHILTQLVAIIRDCQPDAVLVAGDIYDRAVPHPDAVALLDQVLSEVVLSCGVPVVLIAGNHDSPARVEFGARLLASGGLYIAGQFRIPIHPIVLEDAHGPVAFYAVPYAEPPVVNRVAGGGVTHTKGD